MNEHVQIRRRSAVFGTFLLIASVIFLVLGVLARGALYFPIDLTITRALQRIHHPAFHALMYGLTWLGFLPQIVVLGDIVVLGLFVAGLRWEAIALVFAALSSAVGALVKLIVHRPRPTADLVQVLSQLNSWSFPSGHVIMFTTFCGFLLFLVHTLMRPSFGRRVLETALALIIVLMGPSRIYLGQHWFSDVLGAYVLGGLWLVITIEFYRWGKRRFPRFAGS